jgi:hypothetical protein
MSRRNVWQPTGAGGNCASTGTMPHSAATLAQRAGGKTRHRVPPRLQREPTAVHIARGQETAERYWAHSHHLRTSGARHAVVKRAGAMESLEACHHHHRVIAMA